MKLNKNAWQLFCKIIKQHIHNNPNFLLSENEINLLNSPEFMMIIKKHRVESLIYVTTHKIVDEKKIPLLEQKTKKITKQHLQKKLLMKKVCALFEENNIPHLWLKGINLQERIDPTLPRNTHDIDVLIPFEKTMMAHKILMISNFFAEKYDLSKFTKTQLKKFQLCYKDNTYRCAQTNIKLELHWRLNPLSYSTRNMGALGYESPFTPEEEFSYLLLHAASRAWFRLNHLIDLVKFQKNHTLRWDKIIKMMQTYHAMQALIEYQLLIHAFFRITIPITCSYFLCAQAKFRLFIVKHHFKNPLRSHKKLKGKIIGIGAYLLDNQHHSFLNFCKIIFMRYLILWHYRY